MILGYHWIQKALCRRLCKLYKKVGWQQIPAHTWESQPVSGEGVKINIPIGKTSFCAVKSTVTQQELDGSILALKQSFPLRTEVAVCMNFLKHTEFGGWRNLTNMVVLWSSQHESSIFAKHNE